MTSPVSTTTCCAVPPPDAALRRIVVGALDTNCWAVSAVGDSRALLVDPGGDPGRILAAVADLTVTAIVLTHAHFDHVLAVADVAGALAVPVLAHPADAPVWPGELDHLRRHGYWDAGTATAGLLAAGPGLLRPGRGARLWDGAADPVADGQVLRAGPLAARVWHTPGHTPGGVSLVVPGHVLTGDTLFPGGPGLTGSRWPLSDFSAIMGSARRLLALPPATIIHPGHGPDTSVAAERPHVTDWQQRGW
jgi:glyoxylase-like metal-dependent hydrolase (beta-lactamase superfamily II)